MARGKSDWMSTVGAGIDPGIFQNREQALIKARENEVKLRQTLSTFEKKQES